MGNEEGKDAVERCADEAKVGEVSGPEMAEKGSELIQRLSYDGLSVDAKTITDKLLTFAKDGNIPSLKALMEYAENYVRRIGSPVSTESLGQLLTKALEEEGDGDEGVVTGTIKEDSPQGLSTMWIRLRGVCCHWGAVRLRDR
ncbi:hypothetical protein ACFPT7_18995 [Acidicapsa dinghuensis]|uniref:Uncharacterized protein n=1 Tax=Acidicapsa dinghuensis TaxID=2218256 RepID=A0ABW1EJC9_9BACT|nr:hypothetical protein [Acidicapsa dinghuensis]